MGLSTGKIMGGSGGHTGNVGFQFDQAELDRVVKGLDKLFPRNDRRVKMVMRSALRRAARPLKADLKNRVPASDRWHGGRLKKSISIINGKMRGNMWPFVYVGPKVKVPAGLRDKKKDDIGDKIEKGRKRRQWIQKASGYYFYFLNYGFEPGGKNQKTRVGAGNYLQQTMNAKADESLSRLAGDVVDVVTKRFEKAFGKGL